MSGVRASEPHQRKAEPEFDALPLVVGADVGAFAAGGGTVR